MFCTESWVWAVVKVISLCVPLPRAYSGVPGEPTSSPLTQQGQCVPFALLFQSCGIWGSPSRAWAWKWVMVIPFSLSLKGLFERNSLSPPEPTENRFQGGPLWRTLHVHSARSCKYLFWKCVPLYQIDKACIFIKFSTWWSCGGSLWINISYISLF